MAISETLRPTAHAEVDPTLTSGANAYDGSATTYASLTENVEGSSAYANFLTFASGTIPAAKRQSIVLRVKVDWGSTDGNDKSALWIKAKTADPWTLLKSCKPGQPGTWAGSYLEFDVTNVIGLQDLADCRVQLSYGNFGSGSGDDPPLPDGD